MKTDQVSVDNVKTIGKVLSETEILLLDFDGPICSVFANLSAQSIAKKLRQELMELIRYDQSPLPSIIESTNDPFEVFRHAEILGHGNAQHIEASLRAHEVEAIKTAEPTQAAHESMRKWHDTGRTLAIVSNNSEAAIEIYLNQHGLTEFVDFVSARNEPDANLLKPNTYLLKKAVRSFSSNLHKATLVGDSITDIQAAHEVGIQSIGLANRESKIESMKSLLPSAIISSMNYILQSIPSDQNAPSGPS
jgi:phosphoglycolate phosphatase-like HAD superfamily hydrolase